MNLDAKLKPLKGKYYGTEIEVASEIGTIDTLELWNSGGPPSERELEGTGITVSKWVNNEGVWCPDGCGFSDEAGFYPAREVFEVCDGHYESQETYEVALEIVKRLNDE